MASHEVYQGSELCNLTETTKPAGGGGTSPECVPRYMKKEALEPECVIMLTDGYIGSQDPSDWQINKPILWCIKGNERFNSSQVSGKVVHVE